MPLNVPTEIGAAVCKSNEGLSGSTIATHTLTAQLATPIVPYTGHYLNDSPDRRQTLEIARNQSDSKIEIVSCTLGHDNAADTKRIYVHYGRTYYITMNSSSTIGEMKAAIYDRTGVRPLLQNIIYNSKPIQHTVAISCSISSISIATEIDLWLYMSGRGGGKMAMSKVTYNNCSFSLVNDLEIKSTTKNLKMVVPYELPPPAVEKLILSGAEIRANKNCVKLEQIHSDRLGATICSTEELIVQL